MKKITHSEKETMSIAKKFALSMKGGELLCMYGDLGAGKTTFVKGFVGALSKNQKISSPTFVLMKHYRVSRGKIDEVVHIDAYRISDTSEILNIGFEEFIGDGRKVVIIEWADKIKNIFPKQRIDIHIKHLGVDTRQIEIKEKKETESL